MPHALELAFVITLGYIAFSFTCGGVWLACCWMATPSGLTARWWNGLLTGNGRQNGRSATV
jgi:hypothetical protein